MRVIKRNLGLFPCSDWDIDEISEIADESVFDIELKTKRNYEFHRKVFAFMRYCFDHWDESLTKHKHKKPSVQFHEFRSELTILSGYYDEVYSINGSVKLVARSISYSKMAEEDIQAFYSALINAALEHIFKGCNDDNITNRLMSFF